MSKSKTPAIKTSEYQAFLQSKTRRATPIGFEVEDSDLNPMLFPFQRDLVRWALRIGRAGLFCDTGLGKTIMQLEWARWVNRATGKEVLIVCPLGVAAQTHREGIKFRIPATICREDSDVQPGINITNYERVHKFNCSRFGGVVLDENLLKSYMGKTKRMLIEAFARTQYKLSCTATPAPNDYLELGNHAEFLGIMPSNEMIARWFTNNTMKMCSYYLKPHAERDFWRWLTSWGVCVQSPEDLGHDGSAFVLPPLNVETIELNSEDCKPPAGYLFHTLNVSATTMHKVKRATSKERAGAVAYLIGEDPGQWLIWCDTNYEADELTPLIPGATEIRGSDSVEKKESCLLGFAEGKIKRLLSKPEIAGHGMNFQSCHNMIFAGVSFSFERYYQAVRRCWRFGQTQPVNVYIVSTDAESSVLKTVLAKESAFREMKAKMIDAVREDQLESVHGGKRLVESAGKVKIVVPKWLKKHGDTTNASQM
jgi:hypothetical protein